MSGDALKRVFVVGISGYVFTTDKLPSTRVLSVYHPLQKITLKRVQITGLQIRVCIRKNIFFISHPKHMLL